MSQDPIHMKRLLNESVDPEAAAALLDHLGVTPVAPAAHQMLVDEAVGQVARWISAHPHNVKKWPTRTRSAPTLLRCAQRHIDDKPLAHLVQLLGHGQQRQSEKVLHQSLAAHLAALASQVVSFAMETSCVVCHTCVAVGAARSAAAMDPFSTGGS